MYIVNYHRRTSAVFFCFFIFLFICIARLIFLQFFRAGYLRYIARKQQHLYVELEPRRGTIYDVNLRPQAVNIAVDSLYAVPTEIDNNEKEILIRKLSGFLNAGESYLRDRLYRKKSFVWLARKISPKQADDVKKLKLKGLGFLKESKRCYPGDYLASQIFGFTDLDNHGLEGLELTYDKYLKGQSGYAIFLRDARQKKLDILEEMILPRDGYDLVLTIDEVIQYIAERELEKVYQLYHARAASIVVMDPHTGALLALANRPTFNLNAYASVSKDKIRNRIITDLFEPGSVYKIVTAAAAIEEKKVIEEDKFFCENGSFRVGPHILHDHRPHGWLAFREVIEHSSNIGTVKVAQTLGPEIIYRYSRLFGFGAKSGVDLPGEISGIVKDPRFWSKISIAAVPIGHEVGVTTLQLAAAISVVANGGQLMKPYIASEIRDKYGERIKKFSPTLVHKAISIDTANRLKKILMGAVENGTGRLAKISDFTVAGKTGTAQKLEPDGTYSHGKFIASFIGFAPVDDPVIAIAVTVDEPRPYYFGGVVAAPVFKNVAGEVLRYLKAKGNGL